MTEHTARRARVVVIDHDTDAQLIITYGVRRSVAFEVVGTAHDLASGLHVIRRTAPDVVLIDHHLPDADALDVLPEVRAAAGRARVVVMSSLTARMIERETRDAGACGYLDKVNLAALDDALSTMLATAA